MKIYIVYYVITTRIGVGIISEYGLKIKNIEASTLFEYNIGVRDHYEYKDAMFSNSLFKDFLMDNGLKVWNEESTRDIICLEFNFGSRSYLQEMEHLSKIANSAQKEYKKAIIKNDKYLIEKSRNKIEKISELLIAARKNKNKYKPLSKEELRKKIYNEGIDVEYISKKRNGEIRKREIIHYKMLYRSTGKAKKGSCMFIRDKLYKKALNYLYMGIKLPKENPMIVEISAYAPLISSGIVGKVKINPKNILILKDIDRYFKTNVISVEIDNNQNCIAKHLNDYSLKNTLFDGQALIDSSIFPSWGNGYILLREHFCKMAAFNTNIQQFFKDYFGDSYYNAKVTDMFGNEHYARDIELITTDNAMKWLKFDISYDYWCKKVYENNCMFGVVKTAHESKLGQYQKMSYQMVNSLSLDIMENVVKESVDYVDRLKIDDDFFLQYLKYNQNFSNDYNVLVTLCEHNPNFIRSSYFRARRKKIIEVYVLKLKSGEIMQNAENLTVVGSPYAMLLYAATGDENSVDDDNTFYCEEDSIQCYTERFNSNEYLAFFRSPFNSKNNLMYLHNMYSKNIEKYFNLGKQCIAINMNGTDAQDRSNGMDMDSDFGYTTNQKDIVAHAKMCYKKYPTIVNNIPKDKNVYSNTMDDYAKIDNNLAKSQTDIGESSNLAQIAQTYDCTFQDTKYSDYVCILSVIAQVAIDNAKRKFDVTIDKEIKRIKDDMNIRLNKYPKFWKIIKHGFKKSNINNTLQCPMNYLCDLELNNFRNKSSTLTMDKFFIKHNLEKDRRRCKKVEELISKYSFELYNYNTNNTEDFLLLRSDFDVLIQDIKKVYISSSYVGLISYLIDRAFVISPDMQRNVTRIKSNIGANKSLLLKILYDVNSVSFLKCFKKE